MDKEARLVVDYACGFHCTIEAWPSNPKNTVRQLESLADKEHAKIHARKGDFRYSKLKHPFNTDSSARCIARHDKRRTELCNRLLVEHDA